MSPGCDARGNVREHRFLRRDAKTDAQLPTFTYSNRVTFLPCVNTSGDIVPQLYILKGAHLPYKEILSDGK